MCFRGEIKDLFEKVTKEELEKSILNGDQQKQDHMRYLIQALPFHSDDVMTLEELTSRAASTVAPNVEPVVPLELKKLFSDYGLIDKDGKPVEILPLPLTSEQDKSSSLLLNGTPDIITEPISLEGIQEMVKKASVVKAKDYEEFKPIEEGNKNVSSDMELFLKQFGLGGSTARPKQQKPSKNSSSPLKNAVPSINSSYLIPGYSSLLENIGITTTREKSGKKISTKVQNNALKSNQKKTEEEDYKKLENLLDTIRELEKLNASLTEKEITQMNLKNFSFSHSLLLDGSPSPIGQGHHYSALKNEVKRQNPSEPTKLNLGLTGTLLESSLEATDEKSSTTDETTERSTIAAQPTTITKTTSTTTSAPKVEEKKNSLEDEIEPIEDPEPLPPPRRSGFYMLFDWNSFLEVGEEDKIVVRFDPKFGDPSRFLPVNVP